MTLPTGMIEIGDLIEAGAILAIQDGNHGEKHPKASDYVDDGISFVMANDLNRGSLIPESTAKIPEGLAENLRIGFSVSGDVLLTHKGTIGNTAIVPEVSPYVMLTPQVTYYRVNPEVLNNRYLLYCFRENSFQKVMSSLAQQSTRPYIGITAQRKLKIFYRDIEAQVKIVKEIKVYDDLIDNNLRRIKLLEDTARFLFKEWFLLFRFPGHEHVKISNGVPVGWTKEPLENLLILQRGFDLPVDRRKDGDTPIIASTGVNGYHNEAKVSGPGVVTGRSGSLGTVMYISKNFWPLNTALWVKEFKKVSPIFATFLLRSMGLQNYNGGAAVPTLNRNDIHKVEVVCPDAKAIEAFDEYVSPMFKQIEHLEELNKKLSMARDLLLPRLMNGDITV